MLYKIPDAAGVELFRKKYEKETTGICIAGAVITFLIMISLSGVLYDIK